MLDLALSVESIACIKPPASSQPGTLAALASIDADGAFAVWSGTPPTFTPDAGSSSQHYLLATRQGYDSTGTVNSQSDRLVVIRRKRQAYPNHASNTATGVALSDYIYSTDTISGVTNNSTQTSPKPVANWVMKPRMVVANSLTLEVEAFHRDGVACVEYTVSDGTNTLTSKVSTTVVSGQSWDKGAVLVYQAVIDITSLTNNSVLTCNAKVYPRLGAAASIKDSSASAVAREFSPRHFLKHTTLAASPPYAYVAKAADAPNGIGTPTSSGVVSTTLATAKATPFDTINNALTAIHTAFSATTGVDGCIIMLGNDGGTAHLCGAAAATRTQKCAVITITRDPNVAKASARVNVAGLRMKLGNLVTVTESAIQLKDVGVLRASSTIQGEITPQLQIICDDVAWDNSAGTTTWLSNSHDYHYGTAFTSLTGVSSLGAGTYEHRFMRGVSLTVGTTATSVERYCTTGCLFSGNITFTWAASRNVDTGLIWSFNKHMSIPDNGGSTNFTVGTDADANGIAIVQSLWEVIATVTNLVVGASHDGMVGNVTHLISWHNTIAGDDLEGRSNWLYDENVTTPRTHKLQSIKGDIINRFAVKGDVFMTDGTRIGNFALVHAVGMAENFNVYLGNFPADYAGLGSSIPVAQSTKSNPLWTAAACTQPGPVAGAGGGTYTLQAGSPAKSLVATRRLTHDLAGTARPATLDSAGAYV